MSERVTGNVEVAYGRNTAGRGYCYEATEPVGIGDIVLVPPTYMTPEPSVATVVRLSSDYVGTPPVQIIEVVERANDR